MTAAAVEERFWSKVNRSGECWLWTSTNAGAGYGLFHVTGSASTRVRVYAHRWAYEAMRGPIPDGMELDHVCRNRRCVNPDHLQPVTHAENHARRRGYRTGPYDVGDECRQGHPRTPENTGTNKAGFRFCRPCQRAASARYKRNKPTQ